MGTNYYVSSGFFRKGFGKLHIGKASAGWCFSLRVDSDIRDLEDWAPILRKNIIKNEYGEKISYSQMMKIITERSWEGKYPHICPFRGTIESKEHHAELEGCDIGPNGLFRHKIDNVHCIGHGAGTWDYIIGDFC